MQKLKLSVLTRMIEKKLTGKEIDLLIYISRFQDDTGTVKGVYYRDVCKNMHMSYQKFYDALYGLSDKGMIFYTKNSEIDYDITILHNDFSDPEEYKLGYINTNHNIFYNPKFRGMKANEKLLAMEFMKITYTAKASYQIGTKKFFKKYTEMFGITIRVIRNYLHTLKNFFFIGVKDLKYFITPRRNVYRENGSSSYEFENFNRHFVRVECHRLGIKEFNQKDVEDTAKLIHQYKDAATLNSKNIFDVVRFGIKISLDKINEGKKKGKKQKSLKPKLIHKIVKSYI